jgi:hypothetical protein
VTDRIWTGAAVVYALTMAAIVFSLPDVPDTLGEFGFGIVMIGWMTLPVVGLMFSGHRSRKALIIALLCILYAGFAYLDMLVLNPDPYAALGLVFVPIYQTALVALVWGLDALVRLALRKAVK